MLGEFQLLIITDYGYNGKVLSTGPDHGNGLPVHVSSIVSAPLLVRHHGDDVVRFVLTLGFQVSWALISCATKERLCAPGLRQ